MSPYFFNAGLFDDGAKMGRLAEFYAKALLASGIEFDMVFGPAYKGIPLAATVAVELARLGRNVPFAYNRKEAKAHGEGGTLVGAPLKGRVLIVDDVMSAGTAARESIALIQAAGATPHALAIALDRQEKATENGVDVEHSAVQYVRNQLGMQCLDREQRELSPSGVTRRQIGPSLSDSERAAQEALQRKEAEERVRVMEERRRERALVARYPDKATHDIERNAALLMVDEVTATAEKRIVELKEQRKAFDLEMEFYKKDPNKAPMTLRRKIGENEDSIAEQQRFILGQDQEKRKVNQRFDVELAKLKVLWDAYKP
eukprot:gene12098-11887_t